MIVIIHLGPIGQNVILKTIKIVVLMAYKVVFVQ